MPLSQGELQAAGHHAQVPLQVPGACRLQDLQPVPSPQGLSFASQGPSAPFWSVFTPRVIGTAVARYNFAARDMRELSLREGDVVKIYSRIGGDQGWWRGETNGRIGWFPSTYVEEEGVQ